MRHHLALIVLATAALAGCASPTGIVPIGDGLYMSSKLGGTFTFDGGETKAELYREAAAFCSKQSKGVIPVNSTSQNSGLGTYASAEIQFRCGGAASS